MSETEAAQPAVPPVITEWELTRLRLFCGWLSVDLPELHGVEMPRIAESLERFLAAAPGREGG